MRLSCVVIAHDMDRELPRTVHTLTRGQRGIDPADYEVVIVDNGSREPVEARRFADCGVAQPHESDRLKGWRMPCRPPMRLASRRHHGLGT